MKALEIWVSIPTKEEEDISALYELSQKATKHYDLDSLCMSSDRLLGLWATTSTEDSSRLRFLAASYICWTSQAEYRSPLLDTALNEDRLMCVASRSEQLEANAGNIRRNFARTMWTGRYFLVM